MDSAKVSPTADPMPNLLSNIQNATVFDGDLNNPTLTNEIRERLLTLLPDIIKLKNMPEATIKNKNNLKELCTIIVRKKIFALYDFISLKISEILLNISSATTRNSLATVTLLEEIQSTFITEMETDAYKRWTAAKQRPKQLAQVTKGLIDQASTLKSLTVLRDALQSAIINDGRLTNQNLYEELERVSKTVRAMDNTAIELLFNICELLMNMNAFATYPLIKSIAWNSNRFEAKNLYEKIEKKMNGMEYKYWLDKKLANHKKNEQNTAGLPPSFQGRKLNDDTTMTGKDGSMIRSSDEDRDALQLEKWKDLRTGGSSCRFFVYSILSIALLAIIYFGLIADTSSYPFHGTQQVPRDICCPEGTPHRNIIVIPIGQPRFPVSVTQDPCDSSIFHIAFNAVVKAILRGSPPQ